MRLPGRPLLDPAPDQLPLRRLERRLMRLWRRHHIVLILGRDPLIRQALLRVALDDRMSALLALAKEPLLLVQPQVGLARPGVGTVTGKAVVGEDRTDVAVELNLLCRRNLRNDRRERNA